MYALGVGTDFFANIYVTSTTSVIISFNLWKNEEIINFHFDLKMSGVWTTIWEEEFWIIETKLLWFVK